MQIKRKSTAIWHGNGKEGNGTLSSQSGVLSETQYGAKSRFEEGIGTNPEELIAAAHAGCFSMKLAFVLQAAGFNDNQLQTTCEIVFEDGTVVASHLSLKANIAGIDAEQFATHAQNAKENCPISKLLNTNITLQYTLNEA